MTKLLLLILAAVVLGAAPIEVSKEETCLIRHVKLYKDPAWIAKIETRTGQNAYFSSPKSMFEYYFNPKKFAFLGAMAKEDITTIIVTDYNTLQAIDGKKAYYVYGSRNISPGGDDLPAFSTHEEAELYAKQHRGMRIFAFDEVQAALISLLNGDI